MAVTKEEFYNQLETYKNARGHYAEEALVALFEMLYSVASGEEEEESNP